MVRMIGIAGIAAIGLVACDVTHPVAVVGDGTVFRGTATRSVLEGGWFQATNGQVTCQGQYALTAERNTVAFPVKCSNGMTGIGRATYTNPSEGGGEVVMSDGSRWQFLFGRRALGV
ncbi:MAG: hypothetical protein ACPGRD_05185 [Planktomarina sp.]